MPADILIASLGDSPAVITEAIDLLASEGIQISRARLFVTKDVRDSFDLLERHLGADWVEAVALPLMEDIATTEQAIQFMQEAVAVFQEHQVAGDRLYVCIAGGRKVMSALLALAVQFYGARRLFHIWAPKDLEEDGTVSNLALLERYDSQKFELRMHPMKDTGRDPGSQPELIDIPLIGLFPLLPDILTGLQGGALAAPLDVRRLLEDNHLVDPGGGRTGLGERVLRILQSAVTLPPARRGDCTLTIYPQHAFSAVIDLAEALADHFSFIEAVTSLDWEGDERVSLEGGDIRVPVISLLPIPPTGLRLRITATTPGQQQAACQAISRFQETYRYGG